MATFLLCNSGFIFLLILKPFFIALSQISASIPPISTGSPILPLVQTPSHDLYKMKQEGIFDEIAGIWIGNYENEIQIDKILLDTINDIEFNKPIIKSNNFGHSEKKIVIPIGTTIEINTNDNKPYVKILERFLEE